jgi:hypothetical protein
MGWGTPVFAPALKTAVCRPYSLVTPAPLLDLTTAAEAGWKAAIVAAHPHLLAACEGDKLVQRTTADADGALLVCLAPAWTPTLADRLAAWDGDPPCAVLLLTPAPLPGPEAAAAVAGGVHHWQAVAALADDALAAQLDAAAAVARARWARERALRDALAQARAELDERKWVDRAKGALMSARGMAEDEAFRLLRGAAMNVNLRLGDLSRSVWEATQWADAMNRAGQLRMLSQRLVRLAAQRLLKMDARAAKSLQDQALQRMRDNLEMLVKQSAGTAAEADCRKVAKLSNTLARTLEAPRLDEAGLQRIDAQADALLAAAEQFTASLQAVAGRRALHVVNECGRQRLRVQQVAKTSLLAALHREGSAGLAQARRRDATLAEFEAAQRALETAPLSSPEIRATLDLAREDWLRLLAGLRADESGDGQRALVQASETLLERLDALTAAYEHSLQVIMG